MITKTIKLGKGEFTSFSDEFSTHDVIILTGARGAGKSYPVAKYVSNMLLENENSKFIYMRIKDDELATFASWCKDMELKAIANNAHSVNLQRGKPGKGDITLFGYDEDGNQSYERVIGKCVSLQSSHHFKSGKYDEFKAIVFEEYTHLKMQPGNEKAYVFNFLENVVSIFRQRKKTIFLLCNNLKNIPLLDRTIDEMTGELFENPIKIKIFRQDSNNKKNSFLAYLNGELYEEDSFKVNVDEFHRLYVNKKFVLMKHRVFRGKYYIMANKNEQKLIYNADGFIRLSTFCNTSSSNEFYYQTPQIEKEFISNYHEFLYEIASFVSINGGKYVI